MLDAIEQRVLGVLIEKEKTTPENYPLTINSLRLGCNQKTSRNPVVEYDEETVKLGLNSLRNKGLANTVQGGGAKTLKFKHNAYNHFELEEDAVAVICLLLLRGPLTLGEIRSMSGRMYAFESIDAVQGVINELMNADEPLIQSLPRLSGQKEDRYYHLLGGPIDTEQYAATMPTYEVISTKSQYESRLEALEMEVAELKDIVNQLKELLD